MESLTGRTETVSVEGLPQLFEDARSLLFTNFPIYDENHRFILENLIMGRYLTREIAFTPFAAWKFKLNQKLAEIMPMYNEMYKITYDLTDPYNDTDYTRTNQTKRNKNTTTDRDKTVNTTETETVNSNSNTETHGSFTPGTSSVETNIDTPQSELESFLAGKYMSRATKSYMEGEDSTFNHSTSDSSGNQNKTGVNTEGEDITAKENEDVGVTEMYKGKRGGKSYLELMLERRNNIINIDEMILNDLEELFFMVY